MITFLNNIIIHQTSKNPNLLYCLLYSKDVLKSMCEKNPKYSSFFTNIFGLINFLSEKIEKIDNHKENPNIVLEHETIMDIIVEASTNYDKISFVEIPIFNSDENGCQYEEYASLHEEPDMIKSNISIEFKTA